MEPPTKTLVRGEDDTFLRKRAQIENSLGFYINLRSRSQQQLKRQNRAALNRFAQRCLTLLTQRV